MQFPLSTGAVCALFKLPEHRVRNLIRSGKLSVPCLGGRRLWFPQNVLELAKRVGLDTPEIRNACRTKEVTNADCN